jgi:hypothetical protein
VKFDLSPDETRTMIVALSFAGAVAQSRPELARAFEDVVDVAAIAALSQRIFETLCMHAAGAREITDEAIQKFIEGEGS